jgi:hypothetical protein
MSNMPLQMDDSCMSVKMTPLNTFALCIIQTYLLIGHGKTFGHGFTCK